MLDRDAMKSFVRSLYIIMIVKQHGQAGASALIRMLDSLHRIYDHVAPEAQSHPLVVFKTLNDAERPLPTEGSVVVRRVQSLAQDVSGPVILQILDNGEMLLWKQLLPMAHAKLAATAVVYEFNQANERFYAKEEVQLVPKLLEGCSSVFALPTFSKLQEALEHYRTTLARHSTCEVLSNAWFDTNRLFLREKPERYMRRSLTQYLISTLRDAEPRPEQIVDETHPVDIKVTFTHTNRLALIEIKWLGKSLHDDRSEATAYADSRALSGAKQLADYLDANKSKAPNNITRGYLVVIDARRRRLKPEMVTISRDDGMHYCDKEIEYSPQYHKIREDFEEPIRMFVEPKYNV